MLEIKNVDFSYGSNKIFQGLNMEIKEGEFVCILGQSGCGKSTVLNLLSGLIFPDSGRVLINGQNVQGPNLDISLVFQDYSLFPWKTAGQNLELAVKQKYPDLSGKSVQQKIMSMFEMVGLSNDTYDKYPNELSGGMQQRCAILRSFLIDSSIMLMDEPFAALDAITRAHLQRKVLELWEDEKNGKKTVVFVTHDLDEALYLGNKIFVMKTVPSQVIYQTQIQKGKNIDRNIYLEEPFIKKVRSEITQIMREQITKI